MRAAVPLSAGANMAEAARLGFDACGIARADRHPRLARLASWITEGCAGDMAYLSDSLDERLDPVQVLPTVRSVVSLAVVYHTGEPYSTEVTDPARGVIARYAWGEDYHVVVRQRLRALVAWMAAEAGRGFEAFSCVDDGPVQERVFAEQAGIGWIGKHTCVISRELGSWIFLAEVLTNHDLEADAPATDHCGACTRCLEACPTGAIVQPYTLDATRCLSYLTIETRGDVPVDRRAAMGRHIAGCDICQDVCPWNRRPATSADPAWRPRPGLAYGSLLDWCRLPDEDWRALLKGSALRRAGLRRIRRSLAYAASHLAGADATAALNALAAHPSGGDPHVAAAIDWARTALEGDGPVDAVRP